MGIMIQWKAFGEEDEGAGLDFERRRGMKE
jgi:hypothetical protein